MWNEEKTRLQSFRNYPQYAGQHPAVLALNGFVYCGRGIEDTVLCSFCRFKKRDWKAEDDVTVVHRTLSPNCPMATGLRCDNVPFSVHSEATYRDNVSGGNGGVLIQGRRASQDRSEDVALDPATGARRSGSQAASVSQAERAPSRGSTPRSFTNQGEGQDENPPMDLQQNSHRVLPSFPSRMESFIDT
ncbi:unnamed protein product, partial [Lymnaea stagnalis]